MELKRKRSIDRSTAFKVLYQIIGEERTHEREFVNIKSLRQWVDRNESVFDVFILKTLALIDNKWEPFTTIGKKTITLSDLEKIVRELREDYKPSKNRKANISTTQKYGNND